MKFYLNFKNDATGLVEITEPVKFDGASFTVAQDSGRYGRDISYGNEEISLEFYDGLNMGFTELLDYYKTYGFESEVEFIIEDFTTGILDFQNAKTDLLTYFECKVIQENTRAIIKRRAEVNVDVFSNKDVENNTITPLVAESILLKAKPIKQVSEWKGEIEKTFMLDDPDPTKPLWGFNLAQNSTKHGISKSLSWLEPIINTDGSDFEKFKIIKASTTLENIQVTCDIDLTYNVIQNVPSIPLQGFFYLMMTYGLTFDGTDTDPNMQRFYSDKWYVGQPDKTVNITEQLTKTIDKLEVGESVWLMWIGFGNASCDIEVIHRKFNVNAQATSTAKNSVIKGVRYADLFNQNIKAISDLAVTNTIDRNQFAFNGKLIRQFTDKPFYVNFKDLTSNLQETNFDYQINKTNVYIGGYPDFYRNVESGAFLQAPDSDFSSVFNQRYTINLLEYKYATYEQNKDETNTTDAIHTEAQFLIPNKLVENKKEINVKIIRDAFSIESARRQGINTKDTTALDNDDKIFVIDVVALAENTKDGFNAELLMRISDGNLQILNNNLAGDYDPFNWTLLGFDATSTFTILSGENAGNYNIVTLEPTIITLSPIGFTPTYTGDAVIKVEYTLNDVSFVNRTNEGFTKIENLESGTNYSNLRYSIKRNLKYWSSYLKTAMKFNNSSITNTSFKYNGELTTRYGSETIDLIEKGSISTFDDAILSPIIYKTKVVANFEMVKNMLDSLATNYGFLRLVDTNERVIKVHPIKLDYEWATNLLTIEGEERNESDYLTIYKVGDLIKINEVGYNIKLIKSNWFKIDGFFLHLYDLNGIPLANKTRFNKVKVEGVIPTSEINLAELLYGL